MELKTEADMNRSTVESQRVELEKASKEIEVLATALEMRADEMQLGGDLRSGLLYELSHKRSEVQQLTQQLSMSNQRLAASEVELRQTKDALSRCQSDIATIAERASRLGSELAAEQALKQDLQKVRVVM